jgi:hypothetical protein
MNIKIYTTLEELMNTHIILPDNFVMPDFPIPTEDIASTSQILNLIEFIKEHKLYFTKISQIS